MYVAFGYAIFAIVVCYSIIIWCSWGIYKYLEEISHIDSHIMEIQKQLTRTLIIQAVIPFLTVCIPECLIFLTLIAPVEPPKYLSGVLGLMLTYVPLENALSVFLFVKAYRNFGINLLKNIIRKITCRKKLVLITHINIAAIPKC